MDDARDILCRIAEDAEAPVDLGGAALALAALARPGRPMDDYYRHLATLAEDVGDAVGIEGRDLEERRLALNRVILDKYGYCGDTQTYDDIQNANLMRVIDRRRGLPVALGILFIHAARQNGWHACGLNFPGHFLIRLEQGGRRAIIDPFNEGRRRDAQDLRDLLKLSAGLEAELSPSHYEAVADRDVLIRLQNNIKLRQLRDGDLAAAERTVAAMLLFAPEVAALWREVGVIRAKLGRMSAAIEAFERYAEATESEAARAEAIALIGKLRQRLN